jgi:hypothetical protein
MTSGSVAAAVAAGPTYLARASDALGPRFAGVATSSAAQVRQTCT